MIKLFSRDNFKFKSNWLSSWRPYFLIFALGFLLYSQTLFFDFTYFDDSTLVLENIEVLQDFKNVGQIFTTDAFFSDDKFYYRPFLTLSFMLDAQTGGVLPFFYHFSNILIHCLAAALLFRFLTRLSGRRPLSLFLSLIFLAHPVLTQAVAWIPGRNDSLLAIFVLGAFIAFFNFLDQPRLRSYLGYLVLFFCALLTKESAIVVPILVIFYFLFLEKGKLLNSDKWLLAGGSVAVGFVWFLLRAAALGGGSTDYMAAFIGILKNSPAILLGLGKFVLPLNLSVLPILADSTIIYGLIVLVILVLVYFLSRGRRNNYAFFGALWFFLFLLPSFIRLNTLPDFLEHRLYLPIIGFIIILLEIDWIKKLDFKKRLITIIALVLLLSFSALSFFHSANFRNRLVFWERAAADAPHSPLAQRNLGVMYYFAGRFDQAEDYYFKALALEPNEPMVHNNLGVIYLNKKDFVRAEAEFKKELEVNPGYDKALQNLRDLYQILNHQSGLSQ
ncbi:MAG: tetratricopeptide repeat protein [Patescibacteria group bacterium]